jgi:hypothetical protein
MKFSFIAAIAAGLLISAASFAECFQGALSSEQVREISSITDTISTSGDIICSQKLSGVYDAPLYVIKLSQQNQTAKLSRTGGGWGKPQNLGISDVLIEQDSRGYVPTITVLSIDASGNKTDELNLKITGSIATATIRFDYSNRPSEFKKIHFKCDN